MSEAHGHSHGLVDRSITRSRAGLRAVALSLVVLLVTGVAQIGVFVATGSVALLADLIHNVGDALTAVPLAIAFNIGLEIGQLLAVLVMVGVIRTLAPRIPRWDRVKRGTFAAMAVVGAVGAIVLAV